MDITDLQNGGAILLTDVLHALWDQNVDVEVPSGTFTNVLVLSTDDFNLDVILDGGEGPRVSIPRDDISTIRVLP